MFFACVGASTAMARDLIAMGIGGWVGAAFVIGYFYIQNVQFDLKTVAIACLLPFTIGLCSEFLHYVIRMNSLLLGAMLLPDVIVIATILASIATIVYVIYKDRWGVRFLDVRNELIPGEEYADESEDEDEGEDEGEDESQSESHDVTESSESEGKHDDNEGRHNGEDHGEDHGEDSSDDESGNVDDTTESDDDGGEEEESVVTPPVAHDARDIIAELGFTTLPPSPAE